MATLDRKREVELLLSAAAKIREAGSALDRVAADAALARRLESIPGTDAIEVGLADRIETLAAAVSHEEAAPDEVTAERMFPRMEGGLRAARVEMAAIPDEPRAADIEWLTEKLRELAASFDAVLAAAARQAHISGYDNLVSETLEDGLFTELAMLATRLDEQEEERELARSIGASRVTSLIDAAREGEVARKPAAPSRSRETALRPPATRRGGA